jgi:hypothetical protein
MINWPSNPSVGDIYVNPNGAKWRWNGKGWVSLAVTQPVSPGVTAITYQFSHSSMDPVDNGTYYIGNITDSPAQSDNSIASRRVKSMTTGYIKSITVLTNILGNLGSNEAQTFTIKNNTKDTSVIIDSDYRHTSSNQLNSYTLTNPLSVEKNDELEIIWEVPVFTNSPTLVRHNFNTIMEY